MFWFKNCLTPFPETVKGKNKSADVNMEELVGNTDDFADSGYIRSIMQSERSAEVTHLQSHLSDCSTLFDADP